MKLHADEIVAVVMATKCSTGVSMVADHNVHARTPRSHRHAYGKFSHLLWSFGKT